MTRRTTMRGAATAAVLLALCLCRPAAGQETERIFTRDDVVLLTDEQAIKFPLRRPWDDSDPEMRAVVEQYLAQPGCSRKPGERCPRWKEMQKPLVAGGDRLAAYLIRQYEASLAEGYMDTQTMLTMIARTNSDTGFNYIAGRVDHPRTDKERRYTLTALREFRRDDAVDLALDVLARTPETDGKARAMAVRAMHWNIEAGHLDRPDAMARLRSIEARADATAQERRAASKALERLGAEQR